MYQTSRSAPKITCTAFAFATFTLTALAQSGPPLAIPTTSAKPAQDGGAPVPAPRPTMFGSSATMFPPMLEGIISPEEYRKYIAFQQHINEDPALKELDAKISDHLKELRRLRAEATAVREKLISANPEVMAIRDKISGAVMHLLPSTGSTLMPVPVKSN